MKNNFNLDELEDFLSDSAEQHRMYPSDKVWRNIDQELHGSKRWPALTFGAILTGAIITAGLILTHPDKNLFTVNLPVIAVNENSVAKVSTDEQANPSTVGASAKVIDFSKRRKANTVTSYDIISSNSILGTTTPDPIEIAANEENSNPSNDDLLVHANNSVTAEEPHPLAKQFESQPKPDAPVLENIEELKFHSFVRGNVPEAHVASETSGISENAILGIIDPQSPSDLRINEAINQIGIADAAKDLTVITKNKASRWSLLYYGTPSISYRYLSEAKVTDLHQQNGGPVAPNITHGVNDFIRHKPTLGFEFGTALMYNLTPAVRLKAGLQANVRGYSIEAYASKREASTIVLNRGFYTDSLVSISTISNQDGYRQMEITNRYFELSVPLSMDMRVANWKKLQVYVAAGLQPTYQFNQSMYMVSSDYKNYIQDPNLVRHFNMNTSLEAFMSYKIAGITWQAGPQIRYQLLPGATNEYPVRERLIDYGFKIGVVKTLK